VTVAQDSFPTRSTDSKPAPRPRRESLDIEAELRLRPEEAGQGSWMEMRVSIPEPCPSCGIHPGTLCHTCGGEGTVVETRLVRFQVPPGLNDGAVLCVEGHGKSAWKDGPRGDL
jgi:DnaJ-class molecular chaperone